MSNIRLNWTIPVPTVRQRPLAGIRIDARVSEDLPWTELDTVLTDSFLIQDVAPGTWTFQLTVIDTAGRESRNPATIVVDVDFDDPSDVTDLTFTIE